MKLIRDIIAPYGSIGGKMPNKPSEYAFNTANPRLAKKQDEIYHQDFGLFKVISLHDTGGSEGIFTKKQIKNYLDKFKVKIEKDTDSYRKNLPEWPTIKDLFSIKGNFQTSCFDRTEINKLLGRDPPSNSALGFCLQGNKGKSKKIFSFKKGRVWGYCRDDATRDAIVCEIEKALGDSITDEVVGVDFLNKKLFGNGEENV